MFEGWANQTYPIDEPAESFGPLAPFVDLWRGKGRDGLLPSWPDFDIMDFKDWWGWITVFDTVADDPLAFRVRLWGTKVAAILGGDETGALITRSPGDRPDDQRQIIYEDIVHYRRLIDERLIGLTDGPTVDAHETMGRYQEVCLPLASDGVTIDKLMFCGHFTPGR